MAKGKNPYSTTFTSGNIDFDLDTKAQMKQYKREEKETHSAPNTLPYEIGSLPAYFGEMVQNGIQAAKTLENFLQNKNVENKEELLKLKKNTEKMVLYLLQNVDATLDKFTIGYKHRDDAEVDKDK